MVTQALPSEAVQQTVEPVVLAPVVPEIDQPPAILEPTPERTATLAAPETPATPQDPQFPQPLVPDEATLLRRRLAGLEAERQAETTERNLTQEAQTVLRDAIARGLSEEDANWMAQRHYALARQVHQEREQIRQQMQIDLGKRNAAAFFAKKYGVNAELLMGANDDKQMEATAAREQYYANMEVRLKAVEQSRVQPQALDSSGISRAGSVSLTSDNIDKLWLDHERAHPGGANPYETQYRRFLNM